MATLLVLLLAGPAQTISGKYVPRDPVPLPAVLPGDVPALCALIEAGHGTSPLFAALGDALFATGDKALSYRAYDKAQRLGHPEAARLARRKDDCPHVSAGRIRAEEREAEIWTDALASFTRSGRTDMDAFHEQYGRAEDDLNAVVRARRVGFVGALAGVIFGLGFGLLAKRMRRRAAVAPLLVAGLCAVGPPGLIYWGAGAALLGAAAVATLGKR